MSDLEKELLNTGINNKHIKNIIIQIIIVNLENMEFLEVKKDIKKLLDI